MTQRRGRRGALTDHAIPGRHPVSEALAAGRELREVLVDAAGAERGELADIADAARRDGVHVRAVDRGTLDEASGGVLTQGVVAIAPPFRYVGIRDVTSGDLVVVCDHITDPQNLGAIARCAEQAGADALVLPAQRAASVTPAAEKAAAGAFSWLRVAQVPGIPAALRVLSEAGLWTVGLSAAGDPLWDCGLLDERVAVVVGAEGDGLAHLVQERCDALVAIPTAGRLASLNASAAAAVVCFEVRRRRAA